LFEKKLKVWDHAWEDFEALGRYWKFWEDAESFNQLLKSEMMVFIE
jgi:hypothetical protein